MTVKKLEELLKRKNWRCFALPITVPVKINDVINTYSILVGDVTGFISFQFTARIEQACTTWRMKKCEFNFLHRFIRTSKLTVFMERIYIDCQILCKTNG